MKRDLQRLANERFDLCIIGGGINGLATAWDASLRGLRVALVERGDFGGETSAKSLKILHGGLRYLQHLDFSRMRESILERRAFLRIVPELVEPLGFLVPTYPGVMKGKSAMRAAFAMNDWIRGRDPLEQQIPNGSIFSVEEVLRRVPELPREGLTGGALFYDLQMKDSDRVTLAFALAAAGQGAVMANHCEALHFDVDADRIRVLQVRDTVTGEAFAVQADQYACMTGPWRSLLPNLIQPDSIPKRVVKSAGMQLITKRNVCPDSGLALPSRHIDPDARLKRGGRHYFTTPWRGHTIWGTTDETWEGDPDQWAIREQDVDAFIGELNTCLPDLALERSDISYVFGGLRMMSEGNQHSGAQVARRYELYDHTRDLGLSNLISMDGVKYTAGRIMAEKAVDLIGTKVNRSLEICQTRDVPLRGEDRPCFDHRSAEWDGETRDFLSTYFGKDAETIVRIARERNDHSLVAGSPVPKAALVHAIQNESALHLDDLIMRRTGLGTLGDPGIEVMEDALALLAELRTLDEGQQEQERARVRREFLLG